MPTSSLPERGLRPFYAAAGLTDLIAGTVRERIAENRSETARRWAKLKEKAPTLPQQTVRRLVALPGQAGGYLARAETRYDELAGRGKEAVGNLPIPPWAERFATRQNEQDES